MLRLASFLKGISGDVRVVVREIRGIRSKWIKAENYNVKASAEGRLFK